MGCPSQLRDPPFPFCSRCPVVHRARTPRQDHRPQGPWGVEGGGWRGQWTLPMIPDGNNNGSHILHCGAHRCNLRRTPLTRLPSLVIGTFGPCPPAPCCYELCFCTFMSPALRPFGKPYSLVRPWQPSTSIDGGSFRKIRLVHTHILPRRSIHTRCICAHLSGGNLYCYLPRATCAQQGGGWWPPKQADPTH